MCCPKGRGLSTDTDSDHSERDLQSIGVAVTLGFGTAVSLALLAGGGVWLDTRLDTAPIFSLIGVFLGIVAAGYQLYELALVSQKNRENGPLGRKLTARKRKTGR